MNIYKGKRTPDGRCHVTVNGEPLPLGLEHVRHSPDGFNWGYEGSGPAQLAFAILLYQFDIIVARGYYQRFKQDVIANLMHDTWRLTGTEVNNWMMSTDENWTVPETKVTYGWMHPQGTAGHGPFPTRKAALENAQHRVETDPEYRGTEAVDIGACEYPELDAYAVGLNIDSHWLIHQIEDNLVEDFYGYTEAVGIVKQKPGADEALASAIAAWAKVYLTTKYWRFKEGTKEVVQLWRR